MFYEAARRLVVITRSLLMTQLQVSRESDIGKMEVQEGGERDKQQVSMFFRPYCQSMRQVVT